MTAKNLFDLVGDSRQIAVERALAEFRATRPVAITSEKSRILALPAESLSADTFASLKADGLSPSLVVPASYVSAAGAEGEAVTINVASLPSETLFDLLDRTRSPAPALPAELIGGISQPSAEARAALLLTNLALLLPAALVFDAPATLASTLDVVSVSAADVFAFRDREAESLKIVARTVVPLDGVDHSEFVVFRGGDGFRDQIAVIVGKPSRHQPVLVRIHSACLTGDLFGSLKCDCGDQLRGTVRTMSEQGGGIVLYLDQEGRGNGIANKIRAYGLQAEGHDTYDADHMLGFGLDQRRFDFAGTMLRQLGYQHVRLMTNNPLKIQALRDAGLDVVSTQRVLTQPTLHNLKYLTAKRDKAGHLLGDAALDGHDMEDLARVAVGGV